MLAINYENKDSAIRTQNKGNKDKKSGIAHARDAGGIWDYSRLIRKIKTGTCSDSQG